jgi:putative membrane protein
MTTPITEPRRRLHPLSPLLRGGRLAVLAIAAISWQGYQNLGTQRWLLAIGAVALLVLIGSVVSYLVTGYHVVGHELRIYEGLISRRVRAIPVERLQSAELVQPLLARLLGLAELRLEVVGGAKAEAPLAFLTMEEATALRARLLGLARPAATLPVDGATAGARTAEGPGAQPAPEARVLHTVDNRELLLSQLLRPHWWALPFAIAAPIFYFAYDLQVGFVAVASTVTAVIGAIQAPVRALLADWRFTLEQARDGFRIHRGLLETRNQTVPPGRIQSVGVQWPLLWRGFGWVRATMQVAGVTVRDQGEHRAGLLPVATVDTAEAVIGEALPGFELRAVSVLGVPGRAGWLAPLRRLVLGYQLTPTAFVSRDGLLTRQLVIVPYGRIQSVRIRQGPLQRLLRLASVWVDTAGGGQAAVALHRDVAEAKALATELADRSRAVRAATGHSGQTPPRTTPRSVPQETTFQSAAEETTPQSETDPGPQWPMPSPPSTGITAPLT